MARREHPALAKLRAEREKAWYALQAAGGRGVELAETIDVLDARIEAAEQGQVSCRNCGAVDKFVAWYLVDESQGIDVERDEDGSLVFDYDGDTASGEPGADYEYRCRECDMAARSLEYLVGDKDEDDPDDPTIEELQAACEYDPDAEGSVDALIAYKDALEDAYGTLREKVRT